MRKLSSACFLAFLGQGKQPPCWSDFELFVLWSIKKCIGTHFYDLAWFWLDASIFFIFFIFSKRIQKDFWLDNMFWHRDFPFTYGTTVASLPISLDTHEKNHKRCSYFLGLLLRLFVQYPTVNTLAKIRQGV